jgi:hypothetical protein
MISLAGAVPSSSLNGLSAAAERLEGEFVQGAPEIISAQHAVRAEMISGMRVSISIDLGRMRCLCLLSRPHPEAGWLDDCVKIGKFLRRCEESGFHFRHLHFDLASWFLAATKTN